MRRTALLAVLALVLPAAARADGGTHDVGDVAVIDDAATGGKIVDGCQPGTGTLWNPGCYCQEAAKVFYQTHCDEYDALVVFVDEAPPPQTGIITDTEQGTPVRNDTDGIGRTKFDWTAQYGSAGRLRQCVNMTYLTTKPDSPDGQAKVFGGLIPMGLTGIELLGHEFGHHWLMGANFQRPQDAQPMDLLRACDPGNNTDGTCVPNLHYAEYVNSHSVMYGNFLTENTDGSFQVCGETPASPRGYSKLDQYMMGLLPASQAPDPLIWALDDGSHHGVIQDGGNAPGTCSTVGGPGTSYTRVDVSVGDVVRAMGTRSGPAAENPTDWNVGFILVAPSGVTPTTADIAKVDAYRSEFETWFTPATDGLGHVHTEIQPNTCNLPPPPVTDGGTPDAGPPPVVVDAGTPDAGTPPVVDAGTPDAGPPPVVDAGVVDAGTPDAGVVDAGPPPPADAGTPDAGKKISTLSPAGCGCSATSSAGTVFPAVALLLLLGLRRKGRA